MPDKINQRLLPFRRKSKRLRTDMSMALARMASRWASLE
jgi:hypothetical protein